MLFQYIPVLISFIVVMYVWPRVVFAGFLNGKSISYKIFCSIATMSVFLPLLINVLALLNVLNLFVFKVIFYLIFSISLLYYLYKNIVKNNISVINNLKHKYNEIVNNIKRYFNEKSKLDIFFSCLNNVLLAMFILAIFFYCLSFAGDIRGYGFDDMYVHDKWIQKMLDGDMYSDGFYPFGLHCIVYSLVALYNVSLIYTMNYLASIYCIIFLLAVLWWLKHVFYYKHTRTIFYLLLFTFFCIVITNKSTSMMVYDGIHRLCWTLPQESAFWAIFVSAVCLIKILSDESGKVLKSQKANIVLFVLSIATTLLFHYYATIIQFCICVAIALAYIVKFTKEKFFICLFSAVGSIFLAGINFGMGFMINSKLSYSIDWAGRLPEGKADTVEHLSSVLNNTYNEAMSSGADTFTIFDRIRSLFNDGVVPLFTDNFAWLFFVLFICSLLIYFIYVVNYRKKSRLLLSLIIFTIVIFFIYSAPLLTWPRLIESYRLISLVYIAWFSVVCIIVEYISDAIANKSLLLKYSDYYLS